MRWRSAERGAASAGDTRGRVRAIVVELAPVTPAAVTATSRLVADFGYDSLGLLELAAALEDDMTLPAMSADDATGVETLADVQELVVSLLRDRDG
jgi:acyl carrier protein